MAENMPSGTAIRPSDILTMRSGTRVEVNNTDAEGRLILADAISRACEDSPDIVIDVATLTGAQLVALGARTAGVMGNDDSLRDHVVAAAKQSGEAMWPMPLPPDLRKGLDSEVADLVNTGPREGGMLTAGLFLQEFVPEGVVVGAPRHRRTGVQHRCPVRLHAHRRHRRGGAHLRAAARGPRPLAIHPDGSAMTGPDGRRQGVRTPLDDPERREEGPDRPRDGQGQAGRRRDRGARPRWHRRHRGQHVLPAGRQLDRRHGLAQPDRDREPRLPRTTRTSTTNEARPRRAPPDATETRESRRAAAAAVDCPDGLKNHGEYVSVVAKDKSLTGPRARQGGLRGGAQRLRQAGEGRGRRPADEADEADEADAADDGRRG